MASDLAGTQALGWCQRLQAAGDGGSGRFHDVFSIVEARARSRVNLPVEPVMRSERDKMLAGEPYDPFDPELVARRARARDLCQALNATAESEAEARRGILRDL
jgi:hypothetical protein